MTSPQLLERGTRRLALLQARGYNLDVMLVSEQLRELVQTIPISCYRISQETGIAQSVLSRFLRGAGLSMDNVDRLGAFLRIQIKAAGPHKSAFGQHGK